MAEFILCQKYQTGLRHGIADKIAHFSFKNTHLYKAYTKIGTNLIRPFSRDVKDTLLTRKRQLTADSDSKFVRSVVVGLSQGKIISTISSFSSV
jgi:hypothetical protein